jgi:hypothetical protein
VHLRRALLLFAIVLGLAAIVASVSRTERGPQSDSPRPRPAARAPTESSLRASRAVLVRFRVGEGRKDRRLAVGRPATVSVAAPRAGLVSIPGLGLSRTAEPGTPARFEVFETRPERLRVVFSPAGTERQERVGTLVLTR